MEKRSGIQNTILLLFVGFYAINISRYFWTWPAPSDPLQYLGPAMCKTTYGYWPWLDRISIAVNLRLFTMLFHKGYVAGMTYIGFVNTAILILSMFWALRKSGFWAALFVGIFVNSSYFMLGWSTYLYPDQTVALYSLAAFIFFFSGIKSNIYIRPTVIAGFFTALACFSKITGLAAFIFFIVYLVRKKERDKIIEFIWGNILGTVLTIVLFCFLYNIPSFLNVCYLFFKSSVLANVRLPYNYILTYYKTIFSIISFPLAAILFSFSAYKNNNSRLLFMMAWCYVVLLYIIRRVGPPIPNYIYSSYVFVLLGFSVHLGNMIGRPGPGKKYDRYAIIAALLALALIYCGLRLGFKHGPAAEFDYWYNYKPLDICRKKDIIYAPLVKMLYMMTPYIIAASLACIEFFRSKRLIIAFVLIGAFAVAFFNGGLAYKKADFDRKEAAEYYACAKMLNEVPEKKFSVYFSREENKKMARNFDRVVWVYRLFYNDKYPQGTEYDAQYANDNEITSGIRIVPDENSLKDAKWGQILTDDERTVRNNIPGAEKVKDFRWNGMQYFVLNFKTRGQ